MKRHLLFILAIVPLISCSCNKTKTDNIEYFIKLEQSGVNFESAKNTYSVSVDANVDDWSVNVIEEIGDWIDAEKSSLNELSISVTDNLLSTSRSAKIVVSNNNKYVSDTLIVTQLGTDNIVVVGDTKYNPIAARVSDYQPSSGDAKYVYDKDFTTIWHSNWSNTTFPKWLEVDVPTDATSLDYIIVYPRGGNGDWGLVDISYNLRDNSSWVKFETDYNFQYDGAAKTIYLPKNISNIKSFRFDIKSGTNNNASCKEIEFYKIEKSDDLSAVIDAVFTTRACAELKSDVTDVDIKALPKELFDVAIALKNGTYSKEFRVDSYEPHTTPSLVAKMHKAKKYGRADNPTGIWAKKGEKVLVFVGETHGHNISLFGWDAYLDNTQGDFYNLREGVNEIVMKNDALLYVYYYIDDIKSANAKAIEIHIPFVEERDNGYVNGYFDIEKHKTDAEYKRLYALSSEPFRMFDIVGKYCHLIYSRGYIPTDKIVEAFDYYEKMCLWNWEILGIDDDYNNGEFKLRHVFISNNSGYMDASDYRTHYHENTLMERLDVSKMFRVRDLMWGPAHEVGHQIQPIFNFQGYTEGSNNFFSNLFSYKVDKGFKSRGQGVVDAINYGFGNDDKPIDGVNSIPATFKQVPFILMDRVEGSNVFILQRPYWQLYVYYNMAGKNPDFWTNFFELSRKSEYNFQEHPDPQFAAMEIYKLMCDAAKEDLTEFFEAWGWFVPFTATIENYGTVTHKLTTDMIESAQRYVKDKGYPAAGAIEYIEDRKVVDADDTSYAASIGDTGYWEHYRDSATVPTNISVSKSGNTFTISNFDGVAAFELRNGGEVVYKSVNNSFNVPNKHLTALDVSLFAVQPDGKRIEIWRK